MNDDEARGCRDAIQGRARDARIMAEMPSPSSSTVATTALLGALTDAVLLLCEETRDASTRAQIDAATLADRIKTLTGAVGCP